jgi:glucose-1-phosphate cytidylyltransferase
MKVVLLAGGMGTRISEESHVRPKPMIEIGGRPILWHIMKLYSHFGMNDFIICCGYRGYMIKEYFANYRTHTSDVTFDLARNTIEYHRNRTEPWRITLVDTGESTMTGGRLKRVAEHIGDDDFYLTYGDGVSDIDIAALTRFHRAHGRLATVTAVMPPGRYGALDINSGGRVSRFVEKPLGDGGWINGGFFVLSPRVLDLIAGDEVAWEQEPLARLAEREQLMAYQHSGFWQPMDTLRDKNHLERLYSSGEAPWAVWR